MLLKLLFRPRKWMNRRLRLYEFFKPPGFEQWAQFSPGTMEDALTKVRYGYQFKRLVRYASGHVFLSVLNDKQEWERVVLMEFPGVYCSALPGKLVDQFEQILQKNITEQENQNAPNRA